MFPEGSTQKPTEALPVIWENWDEFEKIAEKCNELYRQCKALNKKKRGPVATWLHIMFEVGRQILSD